MTLKERVKNMVSESIQKIYQERPDFIPVVYPDQKEFGDYATTAAMALAKKLRKNPREIATALIEDLKQHKEFSRIELAGSGYINFFLSDDFLNREIKSIISDDHYGSNDTLKGRKILLEFVSANPTGPLHIGHGRWAAIGDSMARILRFCGADVSTEFYVNDAGNQIQLLLKSIEAVKEGREVPENGYHGAYIHDIAKLEGDPAKNLLKLQQETLSNFRVSFDRFYSEKSLHESGSVKETLEFLKTTGHAYENEGALWFKTTGFGDDKDRVLVKSDGEYTYYAVDIAYHKDKISRGFNEIINVLGADHHGYVKRMEAAVKTLALEAKREVDFQIIIGQLVSLFREGEPVRMSKRTGEMITLQEVLDEIGTDAGRYFLVMRKADTPLDFDIETAKKKSDENPVFYVQYAHARISGIIRNMTEELKNLPDDVIDSPEAREVTIEMIKFPEVAVDAAQSLEPHRIPAYLENLAGAFHRFYNKNRVITDDKQTTLRRIQIVEAVKAIIRSGLALVGVEAPSKM